MFFSAPTDPPTWYKDPYRPGSTHHLILCRTIYEYSGHPATAARIASISPSFKNGSLGPNLLSNIELTFVTKPLFSKIFLATSNDDEFSECSASRSSTLQFMSRLTIKDFSTMYYLKTKGSSDGAIFIKSFLRLPFSTRSLREIHCAISIFMILLELQQESPSVFALESLTLSGWTDGFPQLVKHPLMNQSTFPRLTVLKLDDQQELNLDLVKTLTSSFPLLESFKVNNSPTMLDSSVEEIVNNLPNLKSLRPCCFNLTDASIRTIASAPHLQTSLTELVIRGFSEGNLTFEGGLKFIFENLTRLKRLELAGCLSLRDPHLEFLAKKSSFANTLQFLNIAACFRISNEGMQHLVGKDSKLINLEEMDCSKTNISSGGYAAILDGSTPLKRLKKLTITECDVKERVLLMKRELQEANPNLEVVG